MTHYRWAGTGTGDFASAASWIDEDTGLAGAPGGTDSVDLIGTGTITGNGSVATLSVFGGSTFDVSAQIASGVTNDHGRVFLSGGALHAGALTLDSAGEASQGLLLLSGGTLTTSSATAGTQTGAAGLLQLEGASWIDAGPVTIGGSGQGNLVIGALLGALSHVTIGGVLQIGTGAGGTLSLTSSDIMVTHQTTVGGAAASAASALVVQGGGIWTSGSQAIVLAAASSSQTADTLSVTGTYTSLRAGLLSVGLNDAASILGGGAASLGVAPGNVGLSVAGALTIGAGSRLDVDGFGRITGGAGAGGLTVAAGTADFTASGAALVLSSHGSVTVTGGGTLAASGGLLVAGGMVTVSQLGALTATGSASVPAVALWGNSGISVQSGALHTIGSFVMGAGTTLNASAAALASAASAGSSGPGAQLAASVGGSAALAGSSWTVAGDLQVGVASAGVLGEQASRIDVSGRLAVGSASQAGTLDLGGDTLACGAGALPGGTFGLSASSVDLENARSLISAGTLRIGTAAAHAAMTIGGGTAAIAGAASVNGTLTLAGGGTLRAADIAISGGSAIIGSGTISAATIEDQGRIGTNGGTLTLTGAVLGIGLLGVRAGMLTIGGSEQAGIFFGNAGTIVTPSIADLAGTVSGWQAGDAIDFTGVQASSFSFAAGRLTLFDAGDHPLGSISFAPGLAAHNFALAAAGVVFHT